MTYTQWYTPSAILDILKDKCPAFCKEKKEQVMNEAVSFDIEATSTRNSDNQKIAWMYAWALDIFDCTIIGRQWKDFVNVLNVISNYFGLNPNKRIIVYVHNLSYDMQFFRKWFDWDYIFATETRKPLYAITTTGIEFRCSYRLSGYRLSKIGEMMGIDKLKDFDYREIRTPITKLSKEEHQYIIHDVKIVSAYIRKKIAEESGIVNIPLTKTGYVRRLCRHKCLNDRYKSPYYKSLMRDMTLSYDEYITARKAFAGGYTHTAYNHSGSLEKDVRSFDFNSSYPTVLISEMYPMGKGVEITECSIEEFEKYMYSGDCCICTVELSKLMSAGLNPYESYLSRSRCEVCEGKVTKGVWEEPTTIEELDKILSKRLENEDKLDLIVNNGRVFQAERVITTITNVDYQILKECYTFELTGFSHFYVYKTTYLPKPFIECILEFYVKKTELKGLVGVEDEYMNAKENLNSLYGMSVTDIVRRLIEYDYSENEWDDIARMNRHEKPKKMTEEEITTQIDKENKKHGRFLFYLWGVFCTSYARRNLWFGINECMYDYLYSDTDSIKIIHAEKHMDFINRYNEWISKRLEKAMDYHNLPRELVRPKNKKGEEKPLGLWDNDGNYRKFKALRAKSYMYQTWKPNMDWAKKYHKKMIKMRVVKHETYNVKRDDRIKIIKATMYALLTYHMTCAGVNGAEATKYLIKKDPFHPMSLFKDDMRIPSSYTGKLTHTYIDSPIREPVKDKDGNVFIIYEKSFVHLEPCDYDFSLAAEYVRFLKGYKNTYMK